jgi:hypothetical protein
VTLGKINGLGAGEGTVIRSGVHRDPPSDALIMALTGNRSAARDCMRVLDWSRMF